LSNRFTEELVKNSDGSEFDGLKDLGEGLGEEPGSLLDYLRARHKVVARKRIRSMPELPFAWK